jgi:hypothetical protein
MSFNLTKIALLNMSNISMQLEDKFAKIKVNNYCLVNANKVNIIIYVVRLIKDFYLKFFEQTWFFAIFIIYKVK